MTLEKRATSDGMATNFFVDKSLLGFYSMPGAALGNPPRMRQRQSLPLQPGSSGEDRHWTSSFIVMSRGIESAVVCVSKGASLMGNLEGPPGGGGVGSRCGPVSGRAYGRRGQRPPHTQVEECAWEGERKGLYFVEYDLTAQKRLKQSSLLFCANSSLFLPHSELMLG